MNTPKPSKPVLVQQPDESANADEAPAAEVVMDAPSPIATVEPAPGPQPDLEQLLTEIASGQLPVVTRSSIARNMFAQRIREIENDLGDLAAREAMIDSLYQAAKSTFAEHRADVAGELALYTRGMGEV